MMCVLVVLQLFQEEEERQQKQVEVSVLEVEPPFGNWFQMGKKSLL